MTIRTIEAKRILTKQRGGFLTACDYPYTHTLAWAAGCGFGHTYCGAYCYAAKFPNWLYNKADGENWGDALIVKENAPERLADELARARDRASMRIFMSSVTDPYQPAERKLRMTRRLLTVFAQYDDLDLLVIQTRSPLVVDDLELIAAIPYAWVSMTLETDLADLPFGPNAAFIRKRKAAIERAAAAGVPVQVAVSPCLPYSPDFADWLLASGAKRVVVDTFVDGDGSGGQRTAESPFGKSAGYDWRDGDPARALYVRLQAAGMNVGWSAAGFGGIPLREQRTG